MTWSDKIALLQQSAIFDEQWYVERYPDVLLCGMSPAEHYVRIGQHIGRKPAKERDAGTASSFIAAARTVRPATQDVDAELRSQISKLRLFDESWYRGQVAPDLKEGDDALNHYLVRSAADPFIDPSPIFSTAGYVRTNPDTAEMAPLIHACQYGLPEGRQVFDPNKVNDFLFSLPKLMHDDINDVFGIGESVEIVCWEEGNFFFVEIAKYLEQYLQLKGYVARYRPGVVTDRIRAATVVVVAPHEYCVHGPGRTWSDEELAAAVFVNTEQWHTSWFSLAYGFLLRSNKVIDINPASAAGLRALGFHASFVPILPLKQSPFSVHRAPLSEQFASRRYIKPLTYPEDIAERPYDLLFVGASNTRREIAIAALASALDPYDSFIHCPRFTGPVRPTDPDSISTSDLVQIARNAKILINIHQGESRYFEWHRLFLFGILEGCVVLTEPCVPHAFAEAGQEYLECELAAMPDLLKWLLQTGDGAAELRRVHQNCVRLKTRLIDEYKAVA